jgi:hypothetical protein
LLSSSHEGGYQTLIVEGSKAEGEETQDGKCKDWKTPIELNGMRITKRVSEPAVIMISSKNRKNDGTANWQQNFENNVETVWTDKGMHEI